jgi:integrase
VPCPVTHWHLRNIWRKARVKAGIGDVRPHDLRHAMAQWSTDAGADLPMIQAQLGHATVQMTGRYAKRRLRAQHARIMGDLLGVPQSVTQRAQEK